MRLWVRGAGQGFRLALLVIAACVAMHSLKAIAAADKGLIQTDISEWADVMVDGNVIVRVRGTVAFPARSRAERIAQRIVAAAKDERIAAGNIVVIAKADRTEVDAGGKRLFDLFEADAELAGVSREVLAEVTQLRLQQVLTNYRLERSLRVLLINSGYALGTTLGIAALLFGLRRGFLTLDGVVARRMRERLQALEEQSASFVRAQQVARFLRALVKLVYGALIALTLYLYLNFVLGLYPWTRPVAVWLFGLLLDPVRTIGSAVLGTIPDVVFLGILFVLTRYVLRMIRAFFDGVDSGAVRLASFEQEWAWPTYRILRLLVIVFAFVVAYPYIPGSQSDAFKGISLFLGLIVSLGSSSIIANIIAGYSLAYRRPFRVGDRVRINETVGDVVEMGALVTRLRSLKNEEIVIPSTTILNAEVVNYSTLAAEQGLILHTTVGIGYETPWRQVEAMLKLAANRTTGLLKKPAPFVLQQGLRDFAVTYEINAFCENPKSMMQLYTALHQNILDVFNEYGVAIMTPAYVSDPPAPKLVPQDQWYAAPAAAPGGGSKPGESVPECLSGAGQ
jgi:small-conductance mechanosensitive channel